MSKPSVFQGWVVLLIAATMLAGCATPTPTPAPPQVTIVINPNVQEVFVGQVVALSVEASGQDLRFEWRAARGALSDPTAPAVLYTAPDTPGADTVTVVVTGASGATTKGVGFNVIPRPTPLPTATAAPTPTTSPSPTPPAIAITAPLDAAQCAPADFCDFEVRGTSSSVAGVSDWQIFVFLNPTPGFPSQWYPQAGVSVQPDGDWSVQARIGDYPCYPVGEDFQLVAVVLTSKQAQKVTPNVSQPLPEEFVAQSDVVEAVTAYAPIPVEFSRIIVDGEPGAALITLTQVTSTTLSFEYDMRTGGWVLATVSVYGTSLADMSCMKQLNAALSFSLVGTGEPNYLEVQLEDTAYSKHGWISRRGGNASTTDIRIPLDELKPIKGTDLKWDSMLNILFAVTKMGDGAGGRGTVTIRNLVLAP